jgi:uncharacterized membrane protein YozB (DUF420 family)
VPPGSLFRSRPPSPHRRHPRLRPLHRHTGPYVVLVWCLALVTGIYNYVFLYVWGTR